MMAVALQRALLIIAVLIALPFLFARGIARIAGDRSK
jgi:hypothetical protein